MEVVATAPDNDGDWGRAAAAIDALKPVARQVDIDVAQIVFTRATNGDDPRLSADFDVILTWRMNSAGSRHSSSGQARLASRG